MKQQVEARLEVLRDVLKQRNDTMAQCETALENARMNRDRVLGAISELEFLIAEESSDTPEDTDIEEKPDILGAAK